MSMWEIVTTQRTVVIEAASADEARAIFTRKADPPEPFPCPAGTKYDFDKVGAYFDRWPFLSWQHGECIMPGVREVTPHGT